MNVAILGATGVLGRHVLPRLLERGHSVHAVVRTADHAAWVERSGARAFLGDILNRASLEPPLFGCECVMHLATAIPRDRARGDWALNDRIRREGTRNLLDAATARGVHRYVQQSVIMLYGDYGERFVDESAPLQPAPYIQSAVDMETSVRQSNREWCILRGGYFYGPGTGLEEAWRTAARDSELRIPGDGRSFLSLIHVVDMARAVVLTAESAASGSIYNVVDDMPVRYQEIFNYVAAQVSAPSPELNGVPTPSLACSNARIKADLHWQPAYPSYRSGLALTAPANDSSR